MKHVLEDIETYYYFRLQNTYYIPTVSFTVQRSSLPFDNDKSFTTSFMFPVL